MTTPNTTPVTQAPRKFKYIVVDKEQAANVEALDKQHRKRGWKKNAWHFVIERDGAVLDAKASTKVRGLHEASATVGACGPGYNGKTIGICLLGLETTDNQWSSLQALVSELTEQFGLPAEAVMSRQDLYSACDKVQSSRQANDPEFSMRNEEPAKPVPESHIVAHGDTIQSIAEQYGLTEEALLTTLNDNPRLKIGQVIPLPTN